MDADDALGRRVSCGDDRATVRYAGPVPPTAGPWLGVEWDDPGRGKHDGSHQGVRYFTCRRPGGGSFVRPAKVSFGVDFLTAVRQVYQAVEEEELQTQDTPIPIQWIRFKTREFQSLRSVVLNGCGVNGAGVGGEIRQATPNAEWVDLSKSLLSCWEEVAAIAQQLDALQGLQLSYNRLGLTSDPRSLCQAFRRLRVLSLISCDLTWPQVLHCAHMWPQLEELCVEDNGITELQRPEDVLQNLRSLSLASNPLVQESVLSLADLPRLEQLNLSNTGLSVLAFPDADAGSETRMFPSLKELNVKDNNISEWSVVDELAKLPSLVQLLYLGNRLTSSDGNRKTADQIVIAKLGRLETVNHCKILPEERKGAEIDYIKMFGEEWLKAGGRSQTHSEFARRHPRYQSLVDEYGAPEEGELRKPKSFALKNQLLKITFVFPDDAARTPIDKKLPASMDVQKVKGLLLRLLKVPAAELRLSYTSTKMSGTEFEIDSDMKSLQFYSIEDGDRVLVRWS